MNQRTGQQTAVDREQLLEWMMKWYHVPILLGLLAFMFWNRARTWRQFVTDSGVLFSGNDAWYHVRQTTYTVHNWPWTMPFDPWTHFPVGTASGQFGTFYDQIVATVALIVGLGSPDQGTIELTLLFAPAVFGTLTAIPVYLIARRVSGRLGGLTAVLVLSFATGGFLQRTLVGFSDHHAAEAFFQALAILGLMVGIRVATEEKPVYELLLARETDALRRPLIAALIAGVGTALYISVWPPGIMIAAVFSAFFVVQLSIDYRRGQSPEHTAFVGAGALVIAALLVAVRISTFSFTATDFSLLQPALLLLVALGLVVMAAIARWFDRTGTDQRLYPVVILGGIVLTVGTVALVFPDLYSYMVSQSLRFIGLSTTAAQRTVTEAQPLSMNSNARNYWVRIMNSAYGLAFYLAVAGAFVALARIVTDDDTHPEKMLLIVWGVFMTLAVFTQVRFNYYFALPVAVFTGYFAGTITDFLGLDTVATVDDIEIHQVLTVLTVIFLITSPFIAVGNSTVPTQGGSQGISLSTTQVGANNGPNGLPWQSSLEWMANNTPEEGRYDNPNGTAMEYYGKYDQTKNYQYPDGAYGVMAWWDYGHWITVRGERIPNANPFQQGAQIAADFLLETNENEATDLIDGEEPTRYVMVDWQMVSMGQNSKYRAPTYFESNDTVSAGDLAFRLFAEQNGRYQLISMVPTQRHFDSMRTRLYTFNGSAVDPKPVVLNWDEQPVQTESGSMTIRTLPSNSSNLYKQFDNMSAAREFVEQDNSSRLGGLNSPSEPIPALKHYRMVHASSDVGPQSVNGQPWVKTFERVPGATVNGTGPANTTVTANVTMRMSSTGETFTYKQHAKTDEQGQFTMTLPYSTTGYDNWGPKSGHTNVSVRATGPYTFSTNATNASTTANVTETQVIENNSKPVQVTLQSGNQSTNETANTSQAVDSTEMRTVDDVGIDQAKQDARLGTEHEPKAKVA
ncbi:oligosaccharyl transferase, archaeosortase A system-associated [Halocatena pleomorpha]|nr:oligosaccharyl transferase, archaeosortase A system-associated [Halocatena pleomorpha]